MNRLSKGRVRGMGFPLRNGLSPRKPLASRIHLDIVLAILVFGTLSVLFSFEWSDKAARIATVSSIHREGVYVTDRPTAFVQSFLEQASGRNGTGVASDRVNAKDPNVEGASSESEQERMCKRSRSWAACTRYSFCAWKKQPNKEFCILDVPFVSPPLTLEEYNPEFDYKYDQQDERKYFVYQPSGGFNNQRMLLEHALVICQLLNRTCVIPPAAAHTNYFEKYNIQPADKVTPMQRILNFDELKKVVNVVSIPPGQTFMEWVKERRARREGKWKTVLRSYKMFAPGEMNRWTESIIRKRYKNVNEKFLFFANRTMWSAFNWKGSLSGYRQRLNVHKSLMYNNLLKRIAKNLSESIGAYNAIHVRRGDKTTESNFKRVSHVPKWYAERMVTFKGLTPKLYVATDEKDRSYFGSLRAKGFEVVFWEDLDQGILAPFLRRYPARMSMDILSAVEQLLCTYAIKFLGSGYSTLTNYILRMRKRRNEIGYDTALGPELGMPKQASMTTSDCNPLSQLPHRVPC